MKNPKKPRAVARLDFYERYFRYTRHWEVSLVLPTGANCKIQDFGEGGKARRKAQSLARLINGVLSARVQ